MIMDITLCTNKNCQRRKDCWRYRAYSTSEWQSVCNFPTTENCEHFLKIQKSYRLNEWKE